MKIQVKNLGPLKQAEFEPGDFTIICGYNNTGKTYITYAFSGFLELWREVVSITVPDKNVAQLLADGVTTINIQEYINNAQTILDQGCKAYTKLLPRVFASAEKKFSKTEFHVNIDTTHIDINKSFEKTISSAEFDQFSISKSSDNAGMTITLLGNKEKIRNIPHENIERHICDAIKDVVFGHVFPGPVMASMERTGEVMFRKELLFTQNLAKEHREYISYAMPVIRSIESSRYLKEITKKDSYIAKECPELLDDFASIVGGEYTITENDVLYFRPKGKRIALTMSESSSSVRSLLEVGFYLRHAAKRGGMLMVDEPELALHPENQRLITRLFARLVNIGIKVFITTHSDYIIKELNTLIMLNNVNNMPHLKAIMDKEGYKPEELISADKVKVYITEEKLIKLEGEPRRKRHQTLVPADIDPSFGIEAISFDKTINDMNRIYETIIFSEKE
ncbi:MAG: AAA family ATPase [Nitrospirae bacterium]|nr:AAA family ATPase [Nitrospirota bacterium]